MHSRASHPESRGLTVMTAILGLLVVLVGCFAVYLLGQVTIVTCNRIETTRIDCLVERKALGLFPAGTDTIHQVQRVRLGKSCGDESCRYWIEADTASGKVTLIPHIGAFFSDPQDVVNKINILIEQYDRESIQVEDYSGLPAVLVVGLALVSPLVYIWIKSSGRSQPRSWFRQPPRSGTSQK